MKDVDLIALAGLLHDIGKFRQRTGKQDLKDFELGYAICDKQKCSYIHAAHTAKVIEEMGLDSIKDLVNIAASHHKSNLDGKEKVIQLADRLASKLDRKESLEELKQKDFVEVALQTPFSYIFTENNPEIYYYKLQKFEGNLELINNKRANTIKDYEKLYEEFIDECKDINFNFSEKNDILKLKSLLEKYTTFIPASSYKTYPDVSLFDHLLTTSAIAVAIEKGDGINFSLIQGDFTSIQNFIFSKFGESNKYLAKILRAKSLFVNISTELIALKVTKELGLSPLNIVMNAGGKFMILSHKLSDEDKDKLANIKNWVNSEFEKINFLQTKFIIKSIDFAKESFKLGEFSKVYKKLAYKFEQEKLRFIPNKNVFEDYIKKAQNGICEVCGIVPIEENNKTENICKFCRKFKELGEKLPKAKYINFNLDDLLSITLSNKPDGEYFFGFDDYPVKRIANVVPKFNESDQHNPKYCLIKEKIENINIGEIKSFYHIAVDGLKIENNKLIGKSYLAILKADIDNLGDIFIRGFIHNNINESTFSRLLYLSRMIDYFFTNELMDYIKNKNVYTVFAGGDDLFLIGHYTDIVKTYLWIINRFKEYTKNNDFHLSAGIRLTRPNIPVNLMAEFTEIDLENAKNIKEKNSVTIFDISLKNAEFLKLYNLVDFFEDLYEKLKKINSGITFMYRFYDFIDMNEELKKGKNILQNARWKYMLRYLAEKNFELGKSEKDEVKKIKKEIKDDLIKIGEMIESNGEKLKIPLNLFLYSIRQ